ncbi:DUF1793-domain-containing protein [Coniophora puteana RWD-64-598 SS2]|uniref:DUF1793-domain-containing protein n=1 Tax=Coniophora puteana (strain RWD-64-598) TaxID=741705 RepID=A0A5M3MNQ3_CONPW|nr:DUF1793-domain-containing protein [Coniophora puteana RWD-64-598 SS2]EIW80656.1 DUF1793-domain-containing protein [Coniophora puteana RWD-64-598 SS2]
MGIFQALSYASLALFASSASALDWSADPVNPPSVPLAVRTPYLSAWLPQGAGASLAGTWPEFWAGATLGWGGYVRVDGTTYTFLGNPVVPNLSPALATQKSLTYTSTQSTFVLTAGPVDITVNFLSPVEPTDLVKQSTPFSYLAISAAANDGGSHSVTLYSDISAEWASGDNTLPVNWTSTTSGDVWFHQVQLQSPSVYAESNDQSQYGSAYYSTQSSTSATWQTGADVDVRAQFINNGNLANSGDTNFRAINDNWPVFAFAHDLGTVSSASDPVIYAIGHVRDPAIQYVTAGNNLQDRSSYFWTKYTSVTDAINDFVGSYSTALSDANTFDAKVKSDATAISNNYYAIVALSIRQAFGATELTVSRNSDGTWNTDDVLMFMKEISSDGNVNTVDVMMPAWPVLLYTNPTLGKYLLLGLFQYQQTGLYPNTWAVHDLGASYPKAIGHNDGNDEKMPLEECGNMLIMALSYTQKSNDQSLISTYTKLLEQWTGYLVDEALIPADQISTDDFAGSLANQTNLAIKGTVGIAAMAAIEGLLGNTDAQQNYSSIVSSYSPQIIQFASASNHLELNYGASDSWGLTYNMYADKLLGTNAFPQSLFDSQTAWYKGVINQYGAPLDTRHTYTKSDWQIWTAAFVTDNTVRDAMIDAVYAYIGDGQNNVPFSDWYDSVAGTTSGFRARPVVGGHLALLAL